jgi:dCMP deaminase
VHAAKNGVSVEGATLYATYLPCWYCFKLIANAGIRRVVYSLPYRPDPKVIEHARLKGIELVDFSKKLVEK